MFLDNRSCNINCKTIVLLRLIHRERLFPNQNETCQIMFKYKTLYLNHLIFDFKDWRFETEGNPLTATATNFTLLFWIQKNELTGKGKAFEMFRSLFIQENWQLFQQWMQIRPEINCKNMCRRDIGLQLLGINNPQT